jgi:hypothetical protein
VRHPDDVLKQIGFTGYSKVLCEGGFRENITFDKTYGYRTFGVSNSDGLIRLEHRIFQDKYMSHEIACYEISFGDKGHVNSMFMAGKHNCSCISSCIYAKKVLQSMVMWSDNFHLILTDAVDSSDLLL